MRSRRRPQSGARPRVLLCTSNGVGLGHVTRMLAVGEALQPEIDSVMFTLSAALPIPIGAGMTVEHLASVDQFGSSSTEWHTLLAERVDQLIAAYRPDALLFDGVHPYLGLRDAIRRNRRRLVSVWVRRAMWKPDVRTDARALDELGGAFDHILEPGDYAEGYDHGITARHRDRVTQVPPIVYGTRTPRPDRVQACAELGLRASDTNVLVQLGAGQINDIRSTVGAVVSALEGRPSVQTVLAQSVLSAPKAGGTRSVIEVRRFPITHWIAAFDAAVVAAGYNSFHEMLSLRIPTIIVPNLSTRTDDQDARSRWAQDHGVGYRWDGRTAEDLRAAIEAILDSTERDRIIDRLSELEAANGASEAAAVISRGLG